MPDRFDPMFDVSRRKGADDLAADFSRSSIQDQVDADGFTKGERPTGGRLPHNPASLIGGLADKEADSDDYNPATYPAAGG